MNGSVAQKTKRKIPPFTVARLLFAVTCLCLFFTFVTAGRPLLCVATLSAATAAISRRTHYYLVMAVLFSWLVTVVWFAAGESQAARAIEKQGATVEYDEGFPISTLRPFPNSIRSILPAFLRERPNKVFSYENRLTDMEPFRQLKGLQILVLCGEEIVSLDSLRGHRNLSKVYLHDTLVTDLSPLRDASSLWGIDIVDTPVTDIAPVAQLRGIARIYLIGTETRDISCLSNSSSLLLLTLQDTRVSDFSPLYGLEKLESVTLPQSTAPRALKLLHESLPTCEIIATDKQLYIRGKGMKWPGCLE